MPYVLNFQILQDLFVAKRLKCRRERFHKLDETFYKDEVLALKDLAN